MSNVKRIAKNTLFLYIRMFVIMGISLYTSRVVLNILGVEDFGIYNIVGGIVVLFSFINAAMTSSTQRFLNFEIGKKNIEKIKQIYSTSIRIHGVITIIVIILGEIVGIWFLNNKLNIPSERLGAANAVFQFSIITFAFNILKTPFNASVIAFERMSYYSYISILEALLKLSTIFLLSIIVYDKLILYSILTCMVSLIVLLSFWAYVKISISECQYVRARDKYLESDMIRFSGWSIFGNVALIGSNQGIAMILNIFIGVVINTALGVANQVNTAIYSFISNFQMAFSPQIVSTFSSKSYSSHNKLVINASVFSYYLILLLTVPILFYTRFVLAFWLKIVPSYAIEFTQLILIMSFIDALSGPYWAAINASGRIKIYQIGVCILLFANLPLAYLLLLYGYSPIWVMYSKLVISVILLFFRIVMFVRSSIELDLRFFYRKYVKMILTSILLFLLLYFLKMTIFSGKDSIKDFMFFNSIFILIFFMAVFYIGMDCEDRIQIIGFFKRKLNRR